jgi:lysophospholipase L1-like esterase
MRTRVIGCAAAIALALSALVLAVAPTARAAEPPRKTYLALGDSLAFGYSQQLFNENLTTGEPPSAFEAGYANDYWEKLHAAQTKESKWNGPINDGCPGETTDSIIGNGPLGAALEGIIGGAHGEAPCAYHNVNGLALHNEYGAGQSQLENALQIIKERNTSSHGTRPVVLVTLDAGSNDLLRAVKKCEKEVAEGLWKPFGETPAAQLKVCEEANAGPLFFHVVTNVAAIMFAIRNGSLFGGVNYTGKIVFGGYYDPYGAVFTAGQELQPSSNVLLLILNAQVNHKAVKPFGGCYANPQTAPADKARAYNPAMFGQPALEPERLQKWTNMANTTVSNGQKNGPDIHPTPSGYEELANNINEECP